eukprot:100937-Pelagomonas_calceolata.AAC.6
MVKTTEDKKKEEQGLKKADGKKGTPKVEEPPELSPEDQTLKDNIELMAERINDPDAAPARSQRQAGGIHPPAACAFVELQVWQAFIFWLCCAFNSLQGAQKAVVCLGLFAPQHPIMLACHKSHTGVQKAAVQGIITEIRSATATMTSVPKPLKFLSPHVDGLKARYEQLPSGSESKLMLADILSVLCTTIAVREGARDALTYRLQNTCMRCMICVSGLCHYLPTTRQVPGQLLHDPKVHINCQVQMHKTPMCAEILFKDLPDVSPLPVATAKQERAKPPASSAR